MMIDHSPPPIVIKAKESALRCVVSPKMPPTSGVYIPQGGTLTLAYSGPVYCFTTDGKTAITIPRHGKITFRMLRP